MNVAIVTGGTRGLGRALSLAFARSGRTVVATYRADDAAADELAGLALTEALDIVTLRGELTDPGFGAALANRPAVSESDHLVLVNNACASFHPQPFHLVAEDTLTRLLDSTVRGSFLMTRALLRPLLRTKGTVVNVLTDAIHTDPPGFSAYLAAKHGLLGLTRALGVEYAERGLRVLSVSPGYMATALTAAWHAELRAKMTRNAPAMDVTRVATDVVNLVDDARVGGRGEDHAVGGGTRAL